MAKMSRRQKTSKSTQSTQTDAKGNDDVGVGGGSVSSWSLLDAATATVNGGIASCDRSPSSYANSEIPLLSPAALVVLPPDASPPSNPLQPPSSPSPPTTAAANATQLLNAEFYEDAATLFDKLVKTEEVRRFNLTRI